MSLYEIIRRYGRRTRRYGRVRFVIEMALIGFPLKMLGAMLIMPLGADLSPATTEAIDTGNVLAMFVVAVLLGPLIETIIGQWLPIQLARQLSRRVAHWILFSALAFAVMHFHAGWEAVAITFGPGVVFAWCWVLGRERSWMNALILTTAAHGLHNMIALLFYLPTR